MNLSNISQPSENLKAKLLADFSEFLDYALANNITDMDIWLRRDRKPGERTHSLTWQDKLPTQD